MTVISSLAKDDVEPLIFSTQHDRFNDSSINSALTDVAQAVAKLLQQVYPSQADGMNYAKPLANGQKLSRLRRSQLHNRTRMTKHRTLSN